MGSARSGKTAPQGKPCFRSPAPKGSFGAPLPKRVPPEGAIPSESTVPSRTPRLKTFEGPKDVSLGPKSKKTCVNVDPPKDVRFSSGSSLGPPQTREAPPNAVLPGIQLRAQCAQFPALLEIANALRS